MAKNYKKHYVNSVIGRVHIDIGDYGVVLKQEVGGMVTGTISLTQEEMEKLARALFAIKKDINSSSPQSQALSPVLPSFANAPIMPTRSHMDEMKAKYEKAYVPWTAEEEEKLKKYHAQGLTVADISKLLRRNEGAIVSRKKKLSLS